MVQIAGFAIVGCCLILMLRQWRPEFAVLLSAAVGLLLLLACVPGMKELLEKIQTLSKLSGIQTDVVAILLKVIGIVYVTEFAAGVCKDAKEEALALKVQIAGKLVILGFALPLMSDVLQIIEDMLL